MPDQDIIEFEVGINPYLITRMRTTALALAATMVSVTSGFGASTLMEDFEGLMFTDTATPQEIAGFGGWVDDESVDFSFLGLVGGSQAAIFGPIFEAPTNASGEAHLSHEITRNLAGTEFSVEFSIAGPDFVPGEDNFGFSLWDGATSLFSIAFETPGGVGIDTNGLQIIWYDSSGTRHTIGSGADILYSPSAYALTVTFETSGADIDFDAMLNNLAFSGTLVGEAGSGIDSFSADFSNINAGDSFLAFDNLSIVPEPQTAVLGLLALVGFALRRRRR
jgi:hypothetical protein